MTITYDQYLEMVKEIKEEADEIYDFRGYGWDMYVSQQVRQLQDNYDIIDEEA